MKNIVLERREDIAILFIDRQEALNALDVTILKDLEHCFQQLEKETSLGSVVITGAGEKAFVAGADISYMESLQSFEAKELGLLGQRVMSCIENFHRPVIAAVNGYALGGGCELAMACDIRVASSNAKFGQPEVNLGVIPGFGGTQRLPRLVGKGVAAELLFTGDIIDAAEAYRIGLVNRVVEPERLLDVSLKMAATINSRGPVAVGLCKEAVNNGLKMDLSGGCRYEANLFGLCFSGEEQKEGMRAFMEKRSPGFTK